MNLLLVIDPFWLAGQAGLPETVLAGQVSSDIDIFPLEAEAPHHALLDARLYDRSMCKFCTYCG